MRDDIILEQTDGMPEADINSTPIANAGSDKMVGSETLVILDGTKSSDPENDTLTYSWSQISPCCQSV